MDSFYKWWLNSRRPLMRTVIPLLPMQNFVFSIVSTLFGLGCIALAIHHEYQWRRRLARWQKTDGVITAELKGDETSSPEIEYSFRGRKMRFVSKYGGGDVPIGNHVIVVYDPETGEAEELKWSNRWLPTIALLFFGAAFVCGGLAS